MAPRLPVPRDARTAPAHHAHRTPADYSDPEAGPGPPAVGTNQCTKSLSHSLARPGVHIGAGHQRQEEVSDKLKVEEPLSGRARTTALASERLGAVPPPTQWPRCSWAATEIPGTSPLKVKQVITTPLSFLQKVPVSALLSSEQ